MAAFDRAGAGVSRRFELVECHVISGGDLQQTCGDPARSVHRRTAGREMCCLERRGRVVQHEEQPSGRCAVR